MGGRCEATSTACGNRYRLICWGVTYCFCCRSPVEQTGWDGWLDVTSTREGSATQTHPATTLSTDARTIDFYLQMSHTLAVQDTRERDFELRYYCVDAAECVVVCWCDEAVWHISHPNAAAVCIKHARLYHNSLPHTLGYTACVRTDAR